MRQAVIVATSRTAVGKATRGLTKNARSDDMAAAVITDLLGQTDGALDPREIDDVIMGCAMPEGSQGMNFARVIALRAGIASRYAGTDGQSLLLQRLADHRPRCQQHHRRPSRYRHRRRRGIHVVRADDRASLQPQSPPG